MLVYLDLIRLITQPLKTDKCVNSQKKVFFISILLCQIKW